MESYRAYLCECGGRHLCGKAFRFHVQFLFRLSRLDVREYGESDRRLRFPYRKIFRQISLCFQMFVVEHSLHNVQREVPKITQRLR